MTLSHKQALFAAFTLLDDLHDRTKSASLLELLADMNPFIFTDRTPADPAIWDEWVNCAMGIQNDGALTDGAIFQTLTHFLHNNEKEYGYDSHAILEDLKAPAFQKRWLELLDKVSADPDV